MCEDLKHDNDPQSSPVRHPTANHIPEVFTKKSLKLSRTKNKTILYEELEITRHVKEKKAVTVAETADTRHIKHFTTKRNH